MAQRQPQTLADPEDLFNDTRMSFGDHIEELRTHLFRAIYGFVIALMFSFFIGAPVLRFITEPVETALRQFHERRVQKVMKELATDPSLIQVNRPTAFTSVSVRYDQLRAL